MPTVPKYDSFQAQPTLQPQNRFDAPAMADTAGRQAQEMGRSLLSAGGQVGQVALDMQREANKLRIDEATRQAVDLDTDLRAEMLQLEGNNALNRPDKKSLPDEFVGRLSEALDKIESGLGNDAQKAAFRTVRGQMASRLHATATEHMVKQTGVVQENGWTDTETTAVKRGVTLWADDKARAESMTALATVADERAKKFGWDKATRDRAFSESVSRMHGGIISSMVDGDRTDLARAYYEANAETMTLGVRERAMKLIEAGDFEAKTQNAAGELWEKTGGDAKEALRLAREKYAGKEEDAIVTRLKTLDAEETTLRERSQRDAGDKAWALYADGKRIPASVWAEMDGRDKLALRNAQRAEANAARAASDAAGKEARDEAFFTLYEDDDTLVRARPEEITALRRQGFTETQVKSLLRKKEKLADEAEQVSVSKHALNNAFLRHGIENTSKKDKALRGMIASRVDEEIYAEQQERGRALTREEKDRIINRQFLEVDSFYRQQGIFGTNTGTRPRKYYEVDLKDSIVIPPADRDRISKTLRDAGVTVTPERLRAYYMRELGK